MMLAGCSGLHRALGAAQPGLVPPPTPPMSFMRDKLREPRHLIPVVLLIGAVLGSIYTGIATATEAAAVGVVGALILSACRAR
jgi:C4-dicarboxylate transporter, DctM subunit